MKGSTEILAALIVAAHLCSAHPSTNHAEKPLPVQLEMPTRRSHLLPNKPAIRMATHWLLPQLARTLQLSEPVPVNLMHPLRMCDQYKGICHTYVQISGDALVRLLGWRRDRNAH
jgi:hypothetical protein